MKNTPHINLDSNIKLSLKKYRHSTASIAEGLAMLLCVQSIILIVCSIFDIKAGVFIVLASIGLPMLFTYIFNLKSHKTISIVTSIIIFIIGICLFFNQIVQAFFVLNAATIKLLNKVYNRNWYFDVYKITEDEYRLCTTVAVLFAIFILSFLFGLLIVQNKSVVLSFILMLPFSYAAIKLVSYPLIAALIMQLCAFSAIYTMTTMAHSEEHKNLNKFLDISKMSKIRTHSICNSEIKRNNMLSSCMMMITITLVAAIGINIVIPRDNYKPNDTVKYMVYNIINKIESIPTKAFKKNKVSGGISGGDISNADEIRYNNQLHLKVKTDVKVPMLLKAYVGSEYRDNGWHDLDESVYSYYSKMSDGFEKESFSPHYIGVDFNKYLISQGENIQNQNGLSDKPIIETNTYVQNVGASNTYIYYPYHLKFYDKTLSYKTDTQILNSSYEKKPYKLTSYLHIANDTSKGKYTPFSSPVDNMMYKYETDYIDTLKDKGPINYEETKVGFTLDGGNGVVGAKEETAGFNSIATKERANLETEYNKFVNAVYTFVPQGLSEILPRLKSYDKQNINNNMDKAVAEVRDFMSLMANYSLKPGKTPKKKDFVEYFLFENRKGYCVHFATAATMILRANGIPTRFVEGYTVTQNDYDEAEKNKSDTIQIRDTNAHAWIEIYQPRLGWIPYEVTPGYTKNSIPQTNYTGARQSSPPQEMDKYNSSSQSTSSDETSSNIERKTSSLQTSSQYEADKKEDKKNVLNANTKKFLAKALVYLALIILILVCIILIKRYIIIKRRKKSFHQNDINQSTIAMYRYIIKLLTYLGYDQSKYSNLQVFTVAVEDKCGYVQKHTLAEVISIANKARFSQHKITKEEQLQLESFAHKLNLDIYTSLNIIKKIWYMYIRALS